MAFNIGPRIGVEGEKELKQALRDIIAQFKLVDQELKTMETTFKRGETSMEGYTKYINKVGEGYEILNRLGKEYTQWAGIAADRQGESSEAANRYRTEIEKVNTVTEEYKNKVEGATKEQKKLAEELEETEDGLSALETALMTSGVVEGIENLRDVLSDCVDTSKEFETAMAGVSRTTGLSGAELDSMGETLKKLSTELPITSTELANLIADAGQLGIQNEELEEFAIVMAKIGTATELTSGHAGELLAEFANITGNRDFERLGAMFVQLGDATATTTTKTIELAEGLAAAASMAGLTEQGMGAIAATVASLGIETATGGTALSTLIQNIYKAVENGGEELENFASVAGMTAGEFKAAWTDNADSAFVAFISGLNDVERNGQSAISLMEGLDIKNARQIRAVLGLAQAEEQLAANMELANEAYEKNTALNEKAETMYSTNEAKTTMFKNSVNNLKIAIGDDLTPALGKLAEKGGDAVQWAADFIDATPGVVAGITGLVTATATLAGGVTAITAATKTVRLLNTALAGLGTGGVLLGVGAALAGVAATMTVLASDTDETIDKMHELSEETKNTRAEFEQQAAAINETYASGEELLSIISELSEKENKSAAEKQILKEAVNDLNSVLPELALSYDEVTDSLTSMSSGIAVSAQDIDNMIKAMAEQERYQAAVERAVEVQSQMTEAYEQLALAREKVAEAETEGLDLLPSMQGTYADLVIAVANYEAMLSSLSEEYEQLIDEIEAFSEAETSAGESTVAMNAILSDAKDELDIILNAYEEAYEEIYESIAKVGGPLEELAANTEISTASIKSNLEAQTKYWEEYGNNLQNLLDRDVEGIERLVAYFNDGSADSAGALAALATATNEELSEMVENLDKSETFKQGLAGAFADAATGASSSMESLVNDTAKKIGELDLSVEARQAGLDTLQGYINGLDLRSGYLYSKIYSIARTTIAKMRAGLDSHSPSREFEDIGVDTLLGFIKGLDEKTKTVAAKMKEIALNAIDAFNSESGNLSLGDVAMPVTDGITDRMGGSLTGATDYTSNSKTVNLGSISFTINALPVQNPQDIAEAVMDMIQAAVDNKEAVFA